ncbi:hypothetical protein AVEN_101231-1 [Araneus ventricosus]|uniref:Uncharacterized protein n=1 Tax=Araneus ventricosus TaxID=182803 RepID=A0A4Y2KQK9_ARAVE|nr:hypothetical protein AVEN_101231-1 [Araneus ventricosus]
MYLIDSERERIESSLGFERVDRLRTSLECERLRGITWTFVCSASWKAGELSVIESAELLLPVNCYLFALLICASAAFFLLPALRGFSRIK